MWAAEGLARYQERRVVLPESVLLVGVAGVVFLEGHGERRRLVRLAHGLVHRRHRLRIAGVGRVD